MARRIPEEISVPKHPYRPWIKEIDRLDKPRYLKELRELSKTKYSVVNFKTALELDVQKKLRLPDKIRVIYIVDIDDPFVFTALEMATLNADYGIECTFNPRLYHVEDGEMNAMIGNISLLAGQEIGYQYEELADCRGCVRLARKTFKENLGLMRSYYTIETLMAHGRTGEGYYTADLFKNDGKYRPALWTKYGLKPKADFYYFLNNVDGGIYYFNEGTHFTAGEYLAALKCFKAGDVVIMLHHSQYLHKGNTFRPNPKHYEGLDGVAHIVPEK